jgi:hypothetical protein
MAASVKVTVLWGTARLSFVRMVEAVGWPISEIFLSFYHAARPGIPEDMNFLAK